MLFDLADTKWKVLRDGPPTDSDLQQMFVYNELLRGPRALLVYPSVGGSDGTRGTFADRDHGCAAMHLVPLAGRQWASSKMRDAVASMLGEVAAAVAVRGTEVERMPRSASSA